ncbi:hypothetical protein G9A89_017600 [Geosiphon pyriformis]|nr:hypothetical protein G9A89_017600 [Geosiphon pyriformis]
MTQFTLFELVYRRKAMLLIKQVIPSYPTETINEENFETTLHQRMYQLMEMLENNRRTAVDNISHAQEQQKERHDKHLSKQPMKFKIKDQVLLHRIKAEKQWSKKFDPKWDGPFHIHKTLGNRAYKLQLKDRILKKVEGGKEGGKEQKKDYKRRYLVPELEEIKEALAHWTELSKTEEWTPDNAQK